MSPNAGRRGRPWRRLQKQVIARDPLCTIRGPRCTGRSTTADHIIPLAIAPHLAETLSNLRGACVACNSRGGALMTNAKRRTNRTRNPPQAVSTRSW